MLKDNWHYLLIFAIILPASWSVYKHNRDAAHKGKNPINFNLSHRRNAFIKEPQPYTEGRKINRHWKP